MGNLPVVAKDRCSSANGDKPFIPPNAPSNVYLDTVSREASLPDIEEGVEPSTLPTLVRPCTRINSFSHYPVAARSSGIESGVRLQSKFNSNIASSSGGDTGLFPDDSCDQRNMSSAAMNRNPSITPSNYEDGIGPSTLPIPVKPSTFFDDDRSAEVRRKFAPTKSKRNMGSSAVTSAAAGEGSLTKSSSNISRTGMEKMKYIMSRIRYVLSHPAVDSHLVHVLSSSENNMSVLYKGDLIEIKIDAKDPPHKHVLAWRQLDTWAGYEKRYAVPHGNGTLAKLTKTLIYNGDFSLGMPHGHGESFLKIKKDPDGEPIITTGGIYVGAWKYGARHGDGTFHTLAIPGERPYVTYKGSWKNNTMSGKGEMQMFTGERWKIYIGDWSDNEPDGAGRMEYSNGGHYSGNWSKGMHSGFGSKVYENGDIYEGEFSSNRRHGSGCHRKKKKGIKIIGQWVNDYPHGSITVKSESDKVIYDGKYLIGKKHGIGRWIGEDEHGEFEYNGEWKENKRCGKGMINWKNGNVYDGEWSDDVPHGDSDDDYLEPMVHNQLMFLKNIIVDAHSPFDLLLNNRVPHRIYVGQFSKGNYHGHGKITWKNGNFYEGEFECGHPCGRGIYYSAEGSGSHRLFTINTYASSVDSAHPFCYEITNNYEGLLVGGQRCGRGHLHWKTTDKNNEEWDHFYSGEHYFDRKHGCGFIRSSNVNSSEVFIGSFRQDACHGYGVCYYANKDMYYGMFRNNKKDGFGMYLRSMSTDKYYTFIGYFDNDEAPLRRIGRTETCIGRIIYSDGTIYNGYCSAGRRDVLRKGTILLPNGCRYSFLTSLRSVSSDVYLKHKFHEKLAWSSSCAALVDFASTTVRDALGTTASRRYMDQIGLHHSVSADSDVTSGCSGIASLNSTPVGTPVVDGSTYDAAVTRFARTATFESVQKQLENNIGGYSNKISNVKIRYIVSPSLSTPFYLDDHRDVLIEYPNNVTYYGPMTLRSDECPVGQVMDKECTRVIEGPTSLATGLVNGYGSITWKDGSKYYGYIADNCQHGLGLMVYSTGDGYLGGWARSHRSGVGKFIFGPRFNVNGHGVFVGHYRYNNPHGVGVFAYPPPICKYVAVEFKNIPSNVGDMIVQHDTMTEVSAMALYQNNSCSEIEISKEDADNFCKSFTNFDLTPNYKSVSDDPLLHTLSDKYEEIMVRYVKSQEAGQGIVPPFHAPALMQQKRKEAEAMRREWCDKLESIRNKSKKI